MDTITINGEKYVKAYSDNELEYCIVRCRAGLFAGFFDHKNDVIYDSRRLWHWDGAASISQMANEGVKNPNECKFAQVVSKEYLREIIEIVVCSSEAKDNIMAVPVWEVAK